MVSTGIFLCPFAHKYRSRLILACDQSPSNYPCLNEVVTSQHAIRDKSQNAAILPEESKLDQKGRSAGTLKPCRRRTDHLQKREVL